MSEDGGMVAIAEAPGVIVWCDAVSDRDDPVRRALQCEGSMTEPKQALTSSGVQVTGQDTAAIIRRHATRMYERQQRAEQALREQESKWKYEERESFVCVAKRVDDGKASSLPLWVASTATEVGKAGIVHTRPEQECFLESQMRLDLARAFVRAGMVRNWDDARLRASKATILFADKVG